MYLKTLVIFLCIALLIPFGGCKAKKCPTFDGTKGGNRVEYKKNGLVRKRN